MRAFVCQRCRHLLGFETTVCGSCGSQTGFDPVGGSLEALSAQGAELAPGGESDDDRPTGDRRRWHRCLRSRLAHCNWLVPADDHEGLCLSCRLTRAVPDRPTAAYRAAFAKAEIAKRRLLYQLAQLRLPVVGRTEDPDGGLAFELLASEHHVVTGHDNGVITIDLNETDDVFREQARAQFGEPYRTLLGHFRHEIGHYYWQRLVTASAPHSTVAAAEKAGARSARRLSPQTPGNPRAPGAGGTEGSLSPARAEEDCTGHDLVNGGNPGARTGPPLGLLAYEAASIFGDYRSDYDEARRAHYSVGASGGWEEDYVSAYASMHPLEDWAETFAHYLHIWDTVQTAASFGVLVTGPVDDRTGRRDPANASVPSEDTASLEGFDAVIADWLPLTVALNAINRSMGRDDLYPFDLSPKVIAKLAFVHKVITAGH